MTGIQTLLSEDYVSASLVCYQVFDRIPDSGVKRKGHRVVPLK
jgi:hypothetical protein